MFSRRHVVAGALAAPFFPPAIAPPTQGAALERLSCCAKLAQLFPGSLGSARELGILCLRCGPALTPVELIDALCPDAATRALVAHGSDDEVRRWADAKIRADYAAGRMARVDGWVFAETEFRLFSLLAES